MKIKWIFPSILLAIAALTPSYSKPPLFYPASEQTIEREAYTLAYDMQHRQARWVYEHLTSNKVNGDADRKKFNFLEDPLIPKIFRSTNEDYARSGFDRGHLCPAADARTNDSVMQETFYLSNISPQSPQFNRGYWAYLEKHVRELTKKYKELHVFTGTLYLPHQEADGKRYVKYQVIGKNDVAVPTHYFKILFDEQWIPIEAFILPNEPIEIGTPLEKFATTVEKVERVAGLAFSRKR